jgi:methyltransferase family protein
VFRSKVSVCNLPFYDNAVEEIIGIDSSREMLALAQPTVIALSRKVTLLPQSAESLPFENGNIDTVVGHDGTLYASCHGCRDKANSAPHKKGC